MSLETMEQSQQAKRKTLAQWRQERMHELMLPSGLGITVRDVTMTDLMLAGKLPGTVVDMMDQVNQSGQDSFDVKELIKNGTEFLSVLNALVEVSMVEPKIGLVGDEDHITLDELPNDDKMYIFNFLNREVEQIKSFREGSSEPVAAV